MCSSSWCIFLAPPDIRSSSLPGFYFCWDSYGLLSRLCFFSLLSTRRVSSLLRFRKLNSSEAVVGFLKHWWKRHLIIAMQLFAWLVATAIAHCIFTATISKYKSKDFSYLPQVNGQVDFSILQSSRHWRALPPVRSAIDCVGRGVASFGVRGIAEITNLIESS